jgi:hypothetical protein
VPVDDVEVDTASSSIEECVDAILSRLSSGEPQALRALSADPVERAG